ncbi:MAG: hypothetical protein HQL91_03345 [Magnetococcales bacterium]|nr:hypothetical protein [Magnetococcales bacterium]
MALFLGIAIGVMSVLLLFVPLVGGYLTVLPGVLAFFVGRAGAVAALVGVVINAGHVLLLSDFIRFNATAGIRAGVYRPAMIYVGLALLQVAAGVVIVHRHLAAASGGTGSKAAAAAFRSRPKPRRGAR